MLFVELALIRWTGSNIVHLSYFSNFVLLGSFLGIGVGFLRGRARINLFPYAPVGLTFLVGLVLIFPVQIDRSGSDLIYFGRFARLRPAGLGHAAIHLRGGRRRDGHDRGGRGAHLRGVRAAGGVPLRHRRLHPGHRGLQRARLHLGAAGGLGRRRGHPVRDPAPPEPADSPGGGAHRSGLHAGPRVDRSRVELVAVLQGHDRRTSRSRPRVQIDVNGIPHQTAVSVADRRGHGPEYFTPVPASRRRIAGQRAHRRRWFRERRRHRPVRRAPSTSTPSRSIRGCSRSVPNGIRITRTRIRAYRSISMTAAPSWSRPIATTT